MHLNFLCFLPRPLSEDLLQIFYFVATAVTLVSLWVQGKTFVEQLRRRRRGDELEEGTYLKKHADRLNDTRDEIRLIYTSMTVGCAEVRTKHDCTISTTTANGELSCFWVQCLPLGILQVIFSQRASSSGTGQGFGMMAAVSLVTTWFLLGMKLKGVGQLPTLLLYDPSHL